MPVITRIFYDLECDCCGELFGNRFESIDTLYEWAEDDDWVIVRHLDGDVESIWCPNCQE